MESPDDFPNVSIMIRRRRFQVRHLMLLMISLGIFLVYSMRVNLSVTIIAMINSTATRGNESKVLTSECPVSPDNGSSLSNQSDIPSGEFLWDQETQSYVLNAFFYGYIVTQIPGGWLSEVVDPGWVFVSGIAITSLLTLATAVVARASFAAFLVLRVLEGIAEGVTYPSMYALLARWSPVNERSVMAGISNIGSLLGTVVTLPLSAMLCKHGFAGGWPSVFYLTGLLGVVWSIFWILLASGSPEKHKFISMEERIYIVHSRDAKFSEHKPVPWLSILTSRGVWLCALVKFCASWSFYTLLTELPSYLSNVLHFDIQKDGFMNASIYLGQALVGILCGFMADKLHKKQVLGVTAIRKTFECAGLAAVSAGLVGVTFARCNWVAAYVALLLSNTCAGILYGGDAVLPIDLAPDFAGKCCHNIFFLYLGAVMGLTNCISNTAGIFAPLVVGYLTESNETIARWNAVFYIAAAVCTFGAVVFLAFGTAEVQPWAHQPATPLGGSAAVLVPSDELLDDDPLEGSKDARSYCH
ncbi:sialin-like [Dermacentor andersoni]|uniref:sialin-like n=1 Tax=Dermacentor andersoni TaxID=34620 RepID=UPI002417172D|nr:sialin-like [Dermacentor andersoni]